MPPRRRCRQFGAVRPARHLRHRNSLAKGQNPVSHRREPEISYRVIADDRGLERALRNRLRHGRREPLRIRTRDIRSPTSATTGRLGRRPATLPTQYACSESHCGRHRGPAAADAQAPASDAVQQIGVVIGDQDVGGAGSSPENPARAGRPYGAVTIELPTSNSRQTSIRPTACQRAGNSGGVAGPTGLEDGSAAPGKCQTHDKATSCEFTNNFARYPPLRAGPPPADQSINNV